MAAENTRTEEKLREKRERRQTIILFCFCLLGVLGIGMIIGSAILFPTSKSDIPDEMHAKHKYCPWSKERKLCVKTAWTKNPHNDEWTCVAECLNRGDFESHPCDVIADELEKCEEALEKWNNTRKQRTIGAICLMAAGGLCIVTSIITCCCYCCCKIWRRKTRQQPQPNAQYAARTRHISEGEFQYVVSQGKLRLVPSNCVEVLPIRPTASQCICTPAMKQKSFNAQTTINNNKLADETRSIFPEPEEIRMQNSMNELRVK